MTNQFRQALPTSNQGWKLEKSTNLCQLYLSRLSLAKPTKLNTFKTPASALLFLSRLFLQSCFFQHRQLSHTNNITLPSLLLVSNRGREIFDHDSPVLGLSAANGSG
jgi:hypothetical protein